MSDASYAMTRHLPETSYDAALERTTALLKEQGFGVLTEIDVKATLKKKIDVDFRRYIILGACNPNLAHQALSADPAIGLLLPCNVTVSEEGEHGSVVSIISPRAMFSVVERDDLEPVVAEAERRLRAVVDAL